MTTETVQLAGESVEIKRPDLKHTPRRQAIDAILKIATRFGVKTPEARAKSRRTGN
jgi:hypothetical protein